LSFNPYILKNFPFAIVLTLYLKKGHSDVFFADVSQILTDGTDE
jgi:hypothetical protein